MIILGSGVKCRGFEYLEHTADVYMRAWGRTLEELFENLAKGMFEVITDTSKVAPKIKTVIEDSGFDLGNAIYRWLEDLLIEHASNNVVYGEFKVEYVRKTAEGYEFRGVAYGEEFNPEKHEPRTEIKAVTYSLMKISRKEDKCWEAEVVFDI